MANVKAKEPKLPLLHVVKRTDTPSWQAWAIRGGALLIALIFCGLFIYAFAGIGFGEAFSQMFQGTFGRMGNATSMKIKCWDTAIYATKLLAIAVALAPAFKMKFWNIGAEGQVLMGAVATAYVMHDWVNFLSGPILYIVMLGGCALFGALWAVIPAIFKAKWGTNEVLFTLMMNYVAMKIMDYFYNDWKGQKSSLETINRMGHEGWLPEIFGHGYALNIVVFLLLAVLMYFYLSKTKHGYEIAVVGESENTARYAGINVSKVIIRTMILSGAICGVVGGLTVAGQAHTISSVNTAGGYGFTAIIVAWLAKFNTLSMIAISLLIMFLEKGTGQLANNYPAMGTGAGDVMIGIVLFLVIGSEFFINYRVIFDRTPALIAKIFGEDALTTKRKATGGLAMKPVVGKKAGDITKAVQAAAGKSRAPAVDAKPVAEASKEATAPVESKFKIGETPKLDMEEAPNVTAEKAGSLKADLEEMKSEGEVEA